jgi:uncharacterized protein YjcR
MRINLMVPLLISLTVLVGCSRISVYVLDQAELVKVRSGETITAKYDGWLLSQRAVNRVMNAKIKAVNLQ